MQKCLTISIVLVYLLGFILKQLLHTIVGISISGLDYIIWFVYLSELVAFSIAKKKIMTPSWYFATFLILIIFIIINSFTSSYVYSFKSYFIGSIITIIFPLTFIFSYSIPFNKEHIIKVIEGLVKISTLLLIILLIERVFNDSFLSTKSISSRFIKTYGFIGTVSSLNITFALFLLRHNKKTFYYIVILLSLFMIGNLIMLKSILSSLVIIILYIIVFYRKFFLARFVYITGIVIIAVAIISSNDSINNKIQKYKQYYLNTSGDDLTPRLLLYREAINIANDHFPFGSGQGTYGSFPVKQHYSDVYISYGLNDKYGLGFDSKPNFLFDSHWASVLGELGYLGTIIYIILFFYPALMNFKYIRNNSLASYSFLNISILLVIFIESLALAIPYQISFIMIYAGITGLTSSFLKNN